MSAQSKIRKESCKSTKVNRMLGSYSGVILELKRIINSSKWNHAWVSTTRYSFLIYCHQHILEKEINRLSSIFLLDVLIAFFWFTSFLACCDRTF